MVDIDDIYKKRSDYSLGQLNELKKRFIELEPLFEKFPKLAVYATGSYARLEASAHSDIDVFFLNVGKEEDISDPRTNRLRLFGNVIDIAAKMGLPSFSNDCEYLVMLHTDDIISKLGSRIDDHENYFTARMLLLLESYCLYGEDAYKELIELIIDSYFRDYPDHKQSFHPRFLLNDICRFWKTMLLNYENKRRFLLESSVHEDASNDSTEKRKTRQKVKNYKLKYSRMTTCFATVAALGSHTVPVSQEDVRALVAMPPRDRLLSIPNRIKESGDAVNEVLDRYAAFLEMTALSKESLEDALADKTKRIELFEQASQYGDAMFRLLQVIDSAAPNHKLLRNVVI